VLALLFDVGGQRYGLDITHVVEVIPVVRLRRIPAVPEYVAGIFRYRGRPAPVIDLTRLMTGSATPALLSARIILVRQPRQDASDGVIGLLVERAAAGLAEQGETAMRSGIATPEAPYLGGVAMAGDDMIQYVGVDQLLPADLRDRLFAEA